jgi:two-component system nitrogen regulation sensor histidine kinase NtrY
VRGEITLRLTAEDDSALISVTDDGIGLPGGEERERLAEPYVTHKVKGTGLGLAIVKKIMEDHGGTLILDDAPDARGARATLRLPWRGAAEDAMEGTGVAAVATAATRDHR